MYKYNRLGAAKMQQELVMFGHYPIDIGFQFEYIDFQIYENCSLYVSEGNNGYAIMELRNKPKRWYKYHQKMYDKVLNTLLHFDALVECKTNN